MHDIFRIPGKIVSSISSKGRAHLDSLSSFRDELFWVTTSSVLINLLALATPLVMLQVFDRIIARNSIDTLTIIVSGAALAVLLEAILRIVRSYLSAWIAARFEHKAMMSVASRMLAMSLHEFEKQGTGTHQDHFKAAQSLKQFYSGQTFQQMIDLPFTLLYIVVVSLINIWIGLLLLTGYTIFSVLVYYICRHHQALVKDRVATDIRRGNFLVEILTNIHTLKSMSMEALMLRRYERLQEAGARAIQRLTYALDISSGIGTLFSPLMTMLVVALGAALVISGNLTTGELAACTLLGLRSLAPIQRLGTIYARNQQEEVMRNDLSELMEKQSLPPEESRQPLLLSDATKVELKNVSYTFPGSEKSFFENVSLKINPGECLLIQGDNGAGKTTLLQLISGIISPTEGEVLIDGMDIRELDGDRLRHAIAYLPQKTNLFEGSLLENISSFENSRIDGALDSAKTLQIGDFVSKLPRGWDSQVGDAAAESMPPGFRQRIAIVRGLASEPKVVLFDDATASIDSQGESFVLEYLKKFKENHTLVLVTQRPSFQKLADRIVTLKDGRLIDGSVIEGNLGSLVKKELPAVQNVPALGSLADQWTTIAPQDQNKPQNTNDWARTESTVFSTFKSPSDFASCLPVLLRELGWRKSAREVAENLPYFTESLDLTGFENTMAQLGYQSAEASCTLGSLDARTMPCLFVPDTGRAFVAISREKDFFLIAESATSPAVEEKNFNISGRAFFFLRVKEDKIPIAAKWVPKTVGRFRPLVIQAGISSLVAGLVLVAASLFLMAVYNFVIPAGSINTLLYLAFGVLAALSVGTIFIVHRARILSYIASRIEYLFGTTILKQVLGLSPSLTERSAVGAQIARLGSFEAIRDLFTGPLASTILESPATLVVLIALGIINPIALIIFIVVLLVYAILYWVMHPISTRRVNEVGRTITRRNEFVIEMVGKMRTIREMGAGHVWLSRFRQVSAEASMAGYWAEKLSSSLVGISYFIMMFAGLMIVAFTVPLTLNQTLGPGALIASMLLMWRVLGPFQIVFTNLTRIERIRLAVKQIENLMSIKGERTENAASPVSRGLKGSIEFQRVSFRYSLNVDPALVGVEFKIAPGELVAITGPNGGGKSTLLKLLLGMYQPQAGAILIDDVDIRQLDPVELRRLIGYAPQETNFFRATVAQNLRLSRPDATEEELWEALEISGAKEQVLKLPMGIDYRIGDNATEQLPASLRQKLGLARAYLTRSPILLFDEPGAGLDQQGDTRFMETLQRLKGKATVLFISHRPSHIKLADTVMVFDKGYLRAAGKPSDLFRPPPPPAANAGPIVTQKT